ncbi:MAG TPA: ATP-binding protein [Puia sp.]|nr:ATP-binding protein [Puia sp.]
MTKSGLITCIVLSLCNTLSARTYTDVEAREAWNEIKNKPVTEQNFEQTCNLIQDVAQTNINISYEILAQYLPLIKPTGNKQWAHILLMNWAKAKESLTAFDEADSLYKLARENASDNSKNYDEVLVATVLMYLEWDKKDSLQKYLTDGEKICRQNHDNENLSFIYTFKAMSRLEDAAFIKHNLDSAILLAQHLTNKNALFTAKYNRAVFYSQFDLEQQVNELGELLELTKDSSLSRKSKLYERTAFNFRNPAPSIYYQLMLVNLLLTDYDNAWKFAELFYDATVKPNPSAPQAAGFNAVMAMVKSYQGAYGEARNYLAQSTKLFHLLGNQIAYPTYNLAAGMLAEYEKNYPDALNDYAQAYKNSSMAYGLHLMPPEIYYAHALILNQKFDSAHKLFSQLEPILKARMFSAIGYYYYKYYAELMKAKGDNPAYIKSLETFYAIKDSLTNFNHYRAIQEVETRMRVHEKELQINRLNDDNTIKQKELSTEKIYLIIFSSLAAMIIALLIAYSRNQLHRKQQAEQIAKQHEILQQNKIMVMQKQHRIDVMQGAIDAEENERHKIADQLHDETGAMLALASLNISSVLEKGKDDFQSQYKIEKAHEILNTVSASIRDISHRLTPLLIEKYGFHKAIEDMAHTVNLSGKLKLETVIIGFEDDGKYSVTFLNNIFRIVQELIHNILKHAQATSAMLELVEHENHISIMVEDDGIGIDDLTTANGKGIKTIQSKIAYLNGQIEIQRKKEKGTLIVIEINV